MTKEQKQQVKAIDAKLLALGKEMLDKAGSDEQRAAIQRMIDEVAALSK